MRNTQGGTKKWCPKCKAERVVKCLPPLIPGPRVHRTYYEDIRYFERYQECQTCWHTWWSAEIPEDLMRELISLRMDRDLRDIKKAAEAQSEEPEAFIHELMRIR